MAKLVLPFVVLLALVGLTVLSDRPMPPADFSFINRGDVTTLDLQTMSWNQDLRVARLLFEGLTRNDVFDTEFSARPAVAESWTVSEDGRIYTFKLRPDAKWSNGSPVTSGDFIFTWRRAMLPDTACDYITLFYPIKGAEAFYNWRADALAEFARDQSITDRAAAANELWEETKRKFDEMVGVAAPDARTLVVELERPVPYFLDATSFAVLYPVYPPLVSAYQSIDAQTARLKVEPDWTKPPRLVSNGPYVLKLWRFKRDMRFEINPHYWDKDSLNIRSISIPSIEDGNAQVMAYRTGAVDWLSDVTPPYAGDILAAKMEFYKEHWDEYTRLKEQGLDPIEIDRRLPPDPRKNIHAFPTFGTYFYNFNCLPRLRDGRPNPFADPKVRRAFTMAVDRQAIVDQVRRRGEPVATTLIPPDSIGGYESPKGLPFDPEAARKLLAEAGYPNGQGFITVDIAFNKDAGHDIIAQAIAKNWEQYLGVSVSLSQKEIKVFKDDLKNANYIVGRASWFGDYGDPTTFLWLNRTGDGNNDRKYSSAVFDGLLAQADEETDPKRRMEILSEAERILVDEDLPLIPIFHYVQLCMFDANRITGISPHPRQEQNLYLVDVYGDGVGTDEPRVMRTVDPAADRPQ